MHDLTLDIVIPGAQKAGTSSLLDALGRHPSIVRHVTAEFPPLVNTQTSLDEGITKLFPRAGTAQLRLAKSAGAMHTNDSFERLHAHNPNARLIFMLRNPVNRMYSAYWFARRTGDEPLSTFSEAIAAEGVRQDVPPARRPWVDYRRRSDYLTPLRRASGLFGRDQLKIVLLEDYAIDREKCLDELQAWLGLAIEPLSPPSAVRNEAVAASSVRLAGLARRSGGLPVRMARRILPRRWGTHLRRKVISFNEKPVSVPPLDDALRRRLEAEFAEHNRILGSEFGLETTRWMSA